jgi:hypothetical protein
MDVSVGSSRCGIAVAWGLGLLVLVVIAFSPASQRGLVNFDDDGYFTASPYVQQGLTWAGVRWAFTSTPPNLRHPLSFLSLMVDVTLFGLEPVGFHVMNAVFHCLSVLILFLILRSITGSNWRSGLASALFAVHPVRVESVAWVAERKDGLAMLFGLLAIAAYMWYVAGAIEPFRAALAINLGYFDAASIWGLRCCGADGKPRRSSAWNMHRDWPRAIRSPSGLWPKRDLPADKPGYGRSTSGRPSTGAW